MFPTFDGPTRTGRCTSCQATLAVAADSFDPNLPTRCYACGGWCQIFDENVSGETVQLLPISDKAHLHRFDVIVFSCQLDDRPRIKRVWGLPGEQLTIRDGKLWIDGRLLRRSWDEFERSSVPVDCFPVTNGTQSRWRVEPGPLATSSPRAQGAATRPVLELFAGDVAYWNYLHPAPLHPTEHPRADWLVESELLDDYVCNQGLSYQTQIVNDYLLSLRFDSQSSGELGVTCRHQNAAFNFVIQVGVSRPTNSGLGPSMPHSTEMESAVRTKCTSRLDLALCDGRLLVRADGDEQIWNQAECTAKVSPASNDQHQVSLVCSSGRIIMELPTIRRDLYLRTNARDGSGEQEFGKLPRNHYFVMGDNLPASVDSRNGLGTILLDQIQGTVLVDGEPE